VDVIDAAGKSSALHLPRVRWVAEHVALSSGIVLLLACSAWYIAGARGSQHAMQRFAALKAGQPPAAAPVDVSLWSEKRIAAWQDALRVPGPDPLGVLRIPRLRLEVPVLEGTDDITLNRAVGHIEDTAVLGIDGNAGIAGHRDGFFRGLKDIADGDVVELETLRQGKEVYRVTQTWIVAPEDVWVLDPTPARSITLVTCYPFYFIGSAPQRFIVRAVLSR
jgi:sortase A